MSAGGRKAIVLGAFFAVSATFLSGQAIARSHTHSRHSVRFVERLHPRSHRRYAGIQGARVIQCVAFAKQDAGIDLAGNARDWWSNAAGVYERGLRPEAGSVLSFRANGRMPLGHVAVVAEVQDSRTITIDQSHWNSRGISRDIAVKDVSENNDWSAVRVQLGHGAAFGAVYPTHGFIYPRPDRGTILANDRHAPMPAMEAAPADLRPAGMRIRHADYEVAEAPDSGKSLDLTVPGLSFDGPNRGLR